MTSQVDLTLIRSSQKLRDFETRKIQERKKNLLFLIRGYLIEGGYLGTAKSLDYEAHLPNNYTVCDNIDLETIYQEYESYYYIRFQKYPKICRRDENGVSNLNNRRPAHSANNLTRQCSELTDSGKKAKVKNTNKLSEDAEPLGKNNNLLDHSELSLSINCVQSVSSREPMTEDEIPQGKLLKPLTCFEGYNEEWRILAEIISREIVERNLNVRWDDIIGLSEAKRLLKEAVVYPAKYPALFQGILAPWKGILLFGPPGTGKTLLARALATESQTTFFNISASSIVSKWRGDSEKLVRVMFDMARHQAPSTIFLDELDALASTRGNTTEHEASRRMKAELLVQMDGLVNSNDNVFLLTASNLPWELDPGILRRLEKRILVDVPESQERQLMFENYLPPVVVTTPRLTADIDYQRVAEDSASAGYTGSDIRLACKEAAMEPMRRVFSHLESKPNKHLPKGFQLEPIDTGHVMSALKRTKPLTTKLIAKYHQWNQDFGSN